MAGTLEANPTNAEVRRNWPRVRLVATSQARTVSWGVRSRLSRHRRTCRKPGATRHDAKLIVAAVNAPATAITSRTSRTGGS